MVFALSKGPSITLGLVAVSAQTWLRPTPETLKGSGDLDLERQANTMMLKSKGQALASENLMKETVAVDALFQLEHFNRRRLTAAI